MIRLSTGLQIAVMGLYGFQSMMNFGVIEVRSGSQPATADGFPTGTLLARVTHEGDPFVPGVSGGLEIGNDSGVLAKVGNWRLQGVASGTAGWWRWKWNAPDDDSFSLYYPRVDGAVGESFILGDTAITPATDTEITEFTFFVRG
jgi:hypothetical protein